MSYDEKFNAKFKLKYIFCEAENLQIKNSNYIQTHKKNN